MTEQKLILSTYRDIVEMIKSNLVRDLIEANSTGTINVSRPDLEKITNLTGTFIDLYAANGYELLMNQTATKK
jgi:hypothetical protein